MLELKRSAMYIYYWLYVIYVHGLMLLFSHFYTYMFTRHYEGSD